MAYALSKLSVLLPLSLSLLLSAKCSIIQPDSVVEDTRFKTLVEGYVYCNMHTGQSTLAEDATLLPGAIVSLNCSLDQTLMVANTKTKENGHFSILSPKELTKEEFQQCKVLIVSSPEKTCSIPADLNGGRSGAVLQFSQPVTSHRTTPYRKLRVGPFAFQPSTLKNHSKKADNSDDDDCDPNCLLLCSQGCCFCKTDHYGNCSCV